MSDKKSSAVGIDGCPGSADIKNPKPSYVSCPKCGEDVEVWSDEVAGVCDSCGGTVTHEGALSCLEWCDKAVDCVGEEKYREYMDRKKKK